MCTTLFSVIMQELKECLEREQKSIVHREAEAFILVVLSHGKKDHVICCDGRTMHIDYITSCFDGNNCKHLKGKPKMFIIQACQTGLNSFIFGQLSFLLLYITGLPFYPHLCAQFSLLNSFMFCVCCSDGEFETDDDQEKTLWSDSDVSKTGKADTLIVYATVAGECVTFNKLIKWYIELINSLDLEQMKKTETV